MVRHMTLITLLLTICLTVSTSVRSEILTESGLVDIPTGEVLKHGIFGVGVHASFQRTTHLQRDFTAFRVNFGMFDRVEMGMSHLLLQDENRSRYALAHIKAQLLSESELIPNVAIGVENLGDKVNPQWDTYQPQSTFFVVSKTFNLPRIHLISGHIGIGNHRFASEEQSIGLFAGVSTELQPAFARGDIAFSLEFDGVGANAGIRHTADSGLRVALGVETLNKPEDIRFLFSISWTNDKMLEQIAGANRLARQAARLASQAKNNPTKETAEE